MPKKQYDLCIKGREYTDKNGNTKNVWENIGSIIQGDNGPYMFLKRTFNPAGVEVEAGRESILVSMFEPKRTDSESHGNREPAPEQGQAQVWTDKQGATWTQQPGHGWTKNDLPEPQDAGMTADIPF